MSTGLVLGLSFARAGASWALLLPLVFLLFLRLLERPPEQVTGTLELWKELVPGQPRGADLRGRIPAWALLAALGLFLGALAWAGPRRARAAGARTWTCVVDRSPSMGLAWDGGEAEPRLERALAAAEEWLARHARRDERVRWLAEDRLPLELARGERPGRAWLEPEPAGGAEPDWELHDRPGTLWITDRAPRAARARAGLFASGGAAVEGAIAADGRTTVWWRDGALSAEPSSERLTVVVREPDGSRLPAVLERVLSAWCASRGFDLVRGSRPAGVLVVELRIPAQPVALELGRDGWTSSGRGAALAAASGADWLLGVDARGARLPLVRVRPGRLEVSLVELEEPSGDPALFALSFGRLFDEAMRPAPGVVALAERLEAGAARSEPGAPPEAPSEDGRSAGATLDAALALAAALCAALAALRLLRGG